MSYQAQEVNFVSSRTVHKNDFALSRSASLYEYRFVPDYCIES